MNASSGSCLHYLLAPLATGNVFVENFRLRLQFADAGFHHVANADNANHLVALHDWQVADAAVGHAGHNQHHVVVRLTDYDLAGHDF